MTKTMYLVCLLAVASMGASACASPQILTRHEYVGDRSVKHTARAVVELTTDESQKAELYNYFVRVCDVQESGQEANCKDSLVLSQVEPFGSF